METYTNSKKKTMKTIINILCIFIATVGAAQYAPAPQQSKSILIFNATAHLGTGEVIEHAAVGFKNGKIELVGDAHTIKLSAQAYDQTIDANGQHLYPGFIAPAIHLGLIEMEAVRATSDYMEVGDINPHVRSLIAFNTESEIIPTVRANGVLLAQPTPEGGVISGTSCVVQLDAWNWEDAAIKAEDGVHLHWPQPYHRSANGLENNAQYNDEKKSIQYFFDKAKAYAAGHDDVDPRLEAMIPVIIGTSNLYIHANNERQIIEAIQFKKANHIAHMHIVGGNDAAWVTELLKEENIGVMIPRVHRLPQYAGDEIDAPFSLAKQLHDAGVLFCFQNSGDMEAMNSRNLPFLAGTAVGHGLPYEEAVKSLTLNAAKILQIDQDYGSIEVGKSATFFLSSGDALDMRTNQLTHAFIDGREITLRNRQFDLYDKYQKKYSQK
jgi:imidazolonepropionase-like amidohydrolase